MGGVIVFPAVRLAPPDLTSVRPQARGNLRATSATGRLSRCLPLAVDNPSGTPSRKPRRASVLRRRANGDSLPEHASPQLACQQR